MDVADGLMQHNVVSILTASGGAGHQVIAKRDGRPARSWSREAVGAAAW
jgi:hypothetical protein